MQDFFSTVALLVLEDLSYFYLCKLKKTLMYMQVLQINTLIKDILKKGRSVVGVSWR